MDRALTILKFLPAVLCGLLVVAWVGSIPVAVGLECRNTGVSCESGTLWFVRYRGEQNPEVFLIPNQSSDNPFGMLRRIYYIDFHAIRALGVPIVLVLTPLLPLAIGPFNRFRFPLWSWFAFTALVAVELAYYLR